jgi:serine protease AprX
MTSITKRTNAEGAAHKLLSRCGLAVLWMVALGVGVAAGQSRPLPAQAAVGAGSVNHPRKVSPELAAFAGQKLLANQRVEVIVQFRQTPTSVHFQRMVNLGGRHRQTLNLVRGGVFDLPLSAVQALENDPDVLYVTPNRSVKMTAADEYEATVGGDAAQRYGWSGAGVGVAVIDSGIADHPDLQDPVTGLSHVVYSQSFVPGLDATDQYGHGTHVAGIIAGNGQSSGGNGNNGN